MDSDISLIIFVSSLEDGSLDFVVRTVDQRGSLTLARCTLGATLWKEQSDIVRIRIDFPRAHLSAYLQGGPELIELARALRIGIDSSSDC